MQGVRTLHETRETERASEERLLLARFLEERRGRGGGGGGASGDAARKQVQGKTFGFVALKLM